MDSGLRLWAQPRKTQGSGQRIGFTNLVPPGVCGASRSSQCGTRRDHFRTRKRLARQQEELVELRQEQR